VATVANNREQEARPKNDQAWPGAVEYRLGFGSEMTSDVLWRCNVLRAGQLYSRSLFATREEAEEFAQKLGQTEPEKMFNVEAIKASTVWN
jgi:hypothetical protein